MKYVLLASFIVVGVVASPAMSAATTPCIVQLSRAIGEINSVKLYYGQNFGGNHWRAGDLNHDGRVDIIDLSIALSDLQHAEACFKQ